MDHLMDESVILTEIQNLRKEMGNGFASIQSTITKLEGEGRDNAVQIGIQSERIKNLSEQLKTEMDRNRDYAQKETDIHADLYAKIVEVRKQSDADSKDAAKEASTLNAKIVWLTAAIALAGGGGAGLLSKLIH